MSNNGAVSARDVLAENLAAIRARVGMSSAQELADKVKEIGGRLDRAAISKIESKARNVSLDEALLLAAALDVAPVHLFVSTDSSALMQVAPKLDAVPADDAREWVRGRRPLPSTNERAYRTAWIPESEWDQRNARVEEAQEKYLQAERQLRVKKAMLDRISEDVDKATSGPLDPQIGIIGSKQDARLRLLLAKLDTAYEAVAEATVSMQDAKSHFVRVRTEAEQDGEPG